MAYSKVVVFLAVNLCAHALSIPASGFRNRRGSADNGIGDSNEVFFNLDAPDTLPNPARTLPPPSNLKYEERVNELQAPTVSDDDDFDIPAQTPAGAGGGSSVFSLLNLASALFPSSSGSSFAFLNSIQRLLNYGKGIKLPLYPIRRSDTNFNKHLSNNIDTTGKDIEKNTLKNYIDKINLSKIADHLANQTNNIGNNTNYLTKEKLNVNNLVKSLTNERVNLTRIVQNLNSNSIQEANKIKQYVNIDDITLPTELKPPPLLRQEIDETEESESESDDYSQSDSETQESNENNGTIGSDNTEVGVDENNAGEQSAENDSQQEAAGDNDNDSESDEDSDEPPGGDGQGGGILGLLAGLSGGEDGQSDLGSLLAAVSGIIANLSGDGVDINALIASGLGLFVGLLSEGEENPGAVIASYLLTSLDTLSGGGSKNNGVFFGAFLSKLIKGTSAYVDPEASSEEEGATPIKDSAGFFLSFLMGLLGDMSKGSSGGSSSHQPEERRDDHMWKWIH